MIDEIPFDDAKDPFLEDSFEVENWHSLYLYAIKTGRKEEFLKKMGDYVKASNSIAQKEFDRYIAIRRAQMKAEDLQVVLKNGPGSCHAHQE